MTDDLGFQAEGRPVVKKAYEIVMHRAEGELTANDHKTFNYLLNRAWPKLATHATHRIPVADLKQFLGPSMTTTQVNECLKRLGQVNIEITYKDATGEDHLAVMHFLSFDTTSADPSGTLNYAFDQILLPMLRDPKIFSLLSLKDMRNFKTLAGERLYENMIMRKHTAYNHAWKLPLDELYRMFGAPSNTRFDNFKTRFIERAVDEVNEHAPFTVLVEYTREGKGAKVRWVTFRVTDKTRDDFLSPVRIEKKRKGKDDRSVDIFDGKTVEERGSDIVISLKCHADCTGEIGSRPLDLQDIEFRWRNSVAGQQVLFPDQAFSRFVAAEIEKHDDPTMVDQLGEDLLGDLLK